VASQMPFLLFYSAEYWKVTQHRIWIVRPESSDDRR
jgi:hypothetical protein